MAFLHRRLRSGNEARISPSDITPLQRVLPKGCYPFLSGRSENLSVFLASLSASTKGVIASANRSAFTLSQSLATPFADPFVGLDGRNLRDADFYTENKFSNQLFVCFIFRRVIYSLDEAKTARVFRGFWRNMKKRLALEKLHDLFLVDFLSSRYRPVRSNLGFRSSADCDLDCDPMMRLLRLKNYVAADLMYATITEFPA